MMRSLCRVFDLLGSLLLLCAFVCVLPLDARADGARTASTQAEAPRSAPVPRFEPTTAEDSPVSVPDGWRATYGSLIVLENRVRPEGPTLRLPVVWIQPHDGDAHRTPVLYLGGGPGASALNVAGYPGAYPFVAEHGFVVLEQRGTRFAEPALDCPELVAALRQSVLAPSTDVAIARQVAAAAACRARLTADGVDLSAYSTAASAADVEDLRRVLGVERWTLYGASYGTSLALAVLRDTPGTVRAAVLDSILPPQVLYDDESSRNLEASIGRIARDCAADAACAAAYPDLQRRFDAALDAADAEPLRLRLPDDALEGLEPAPDDTSVLLRGADLAALVGPSSPRSIAGTPRLLDAIARHDIDVLQAAAANLLAPTSWAWGMRLSVWCSESQPDAARTRAAAPLDVLGGVESAVVPPAVCAAWNVPARPRREVAPVRSEVPILLVAGEYDPATPPAWAHEAARTLPRSRVVVVRAAGHIPMQDWGGDGCAMKFAASFIDDPETIVHPDTPLPPCLAARTAPRFVVPD
ncbi:MAG: alpha/beta hydrolase [Acidobacteriota bacterium]